MNRKDQKNLRPKNFHRTNFEFLKKINNFVSKNSGWKHIKKCPICSSSKIEILMSKFSSNIYLCSNCKHIYSSKIPKNINEAYSNKFHQKQSVESYDKIRRFRINRFAKERVSIIKKFKNNPKLLDYGCGTGWFLEHARTHFDNVEGFEPTKELAKLSSKKIKVNIFSDFKLRKIKQYDVITLFDVIEHVENPKLFLNKIVNYMNKNSILIIFTPNSKSMSFDYLRENGNLIIPPLHLHYFNEKSITKLVKKKFKIINYETKGFDIADIYTFEIENYKFSNIDRKEISSLQRNIDKIKYGNHLRLILKKI